MKPSAVWIVAICSFSAPAFGGELLTGKISEFQCGDNCYLTITDPVGKPHVALCAAPECEEWNREGQMPASFRGKSVEAKINHDGIQLDGEGTEVGRFDAVEKLSFLIPVVDRGLKSYEQWAMEKREKGAPGGSSKLSENYHIAADEPNLYPWIILSLIGIAATWLLLIAFRKRRRIANLIEEALVQAGARSIRAVRNIRAFLARIVGRMQEQAGRPDQRNE